MAKKDQKVEKTLPEHTKRVKDDWDKKRNGGNIVAVSDPRSEGSVLITRAEFEDNKVSIWTGDYDNEAPEFVIVNPPTKYPHDGKLIEDPLTAIAIAILGAKQ